MASGPFSYCNSQNEEQKHHRKESNQPRHIGHRNPATGLVQKIYVLYPAGLKYEERTDRLHVLVNNAGIGGGGGYVEQDFMQSWDRLVDINLKACAIVTQTVLPLLKVDGGSIINNASDGGLRGRIGSFLYDATKAALISATKSMAVEFVKYGIRVNAVAPGWSVTEFHFGKADNPEKTRQELLHLDSDTCIMRRLGRPEEIAAAIAFLASEDASYVTGTCLCVDGGRVGFEIPRA